MKKYILSGFLLLLLFLTACEPLTPVPTNSSAVIAEIQGDDVNVLHVNAGGFQAATLNEKIKVGSQISTGVESRTRLDLSSGTVIRIGPESTFELTANHESKDGLLTRIKINVGQIWIVLNGGTLDVETPSGLAGVRGSYMSTGFDPETGDARITCLEGHCSAENAAGSVQFTAGEAADLPSDGAAPVKGEMTADELQMWADNVPEAATLVEVRNTPVPTPTPTSVPTITPEPSPQLGGCTVASTYLYVRTCPDATCETLGYVETDETLQLLDESGEDGWLAVEFEGGTGWINGVFCKE